MDGPGSGIPCVFPFQLNGNVYNTCTNELSQFTNNKTWCSTKVDETGEHISGNWRSCNENCLLSPNGEVSV